MSRLHRLAALASAASLCLGLTSTALAVEPPASTDGGVVPAGISTCEMYLSTVDGPLFEHDFEIPAYEDFIVWGFGYAPNSSVAVRFEAPGVEKTHQVMTDSAGDFEDGTYFFAPGAISRWHVYVAEPPGGCEDWQSLTLLAPHPFTDVVAFEYEISWLYREGITGGCSATRFCPKSAVTRGQMAAFLNRALGLPKTTTDFFDDDDGTMFEGDINRLAAAGITGGCATRRFCPNANVTREQMASFLVRAFHLPASSKDFFTDDETSQHEGSINALAASGITGGCAPGKYCPKANVTREQMAAFLYRAFN